MSSSDQRREKKNIVAIAYIRVIALVGQVRGSVYQTGSVGRARTMVVCTTPLSLGMDKRERDLGILKNLLARTQRATSAERTGAGTNEAERTRAPLG